MVKPRTTVEQTVTLNSKNPRAVVKGLDGDQLFRFDGQVDAFVGDSESHFPVKNLRDLRKLMRDPEVQDAVREATHGKTSVHRFIESSSHRVTQLQVTSPVAGTLVVGLGHQEITLTKSEAKIVSKSLTVGDEALTSQMHTLHAKATETGYRSVSEDYAFFKRTPIW
jgi:hypothetical protein